MAPDPANFLQQLLKKNLVEKNMAPDPAIYLHQLPQKDPNMDLSCSLAAHCLHSFLWHGQFSLSHHTAIIYVLT